MLGTIIGDTVGSRFEWHNYKAKDFEFLTKRCHPTDDSIMTVAIAKALLEAGEDYSDLPQKTIENMQELGHIYPDAGYGGRFYDWLLASDPQPYNSWGNGSAMRVSPVAYVAKSLEEVKRLACMVTEVTHNHPEGMKGAEATATAIFMALHHFNKEEIKAKMASYYDLNFKLDDIRPSYDFDVSCQGTLPPALVAFFEAKDYEDAIRNAISIGGDSDTIACITGSIAEAYYGVPQELREQIYNYIPDSLMEIVKAFETRHPARIVAADNGTKVYPFW